MIGYKKNMLKIFYKGKIIPCTKIFFYKKLILNKKYKIKSKSKGKGFCGTVKRYGFSLNNKSHGNSKSYRKPGSIGMCQDPGRVFKGKKMCGHKGNKSSTTINRLFYYNKKIAIFLGSIPGHNGQKIKIC
ncbi:50S ribosomal protein L3 [Candidatus Vidania fulgoroideorum]